MYLIYRQTIYLKLWRNALRSITAKKVRYIKLGKGGDWAALCFEENSLRIDHREVPHKLAATLDRDAIRAELMRQGFDATKSSDKAREILDFYDDTENTIWITFADGFLWWCRAQSEVSELGKAGLAGTKIRRCASPWSNLSAGGCPLLFRELSGQLTRTAGYRQTICAVRAEEYLLAKLNDEVLPEVAEALSARDRLERAICGLVATMTWQDFELLVDLVFVSSGWRRTGATGGTQETVDLELVLPSTGERAFVQVKSSTDQAEFADYRERFSRRDEDRMFFVYHSAKRPILADECGVTVIDRERLATMIVDAGLTGWLIDRAS